MTVTSTGGLFRRTMVLAAALSTGLVCAGRVLATVPPSQTQSRSWLGVSMVTDSEGDGARIAHVVRGSPADRAGLRAADRLVRFGSDHISRGADVVRAVANHPIGEVVDVVFVRGGAARTLQVTLAAFPSQDEIIRMDLVGSVAPAWTKIEPVSGSFPHSSEILRGHVVLLDFWATWCAPCRLLMPRLSALQSHYGAVGLSVLGITTEDPQEVARFARQAGVGYALGVDTEAEMTRTYGVLTLPTLVIIDRRGIIRDVAVGYDPGGEGRLEATIRSLLAESSSD